MQKQKNQITDQQIALGVTNIEKDRAIWKAYSEQGGLYDLFKNFNVAVSKPAANANDYDEDENTYVICITLYNAIYLRMKRNLDKLYKNMSQAEQVGKEYIPVVRKVSIKKEETMITSDTHHFEGKLINILKYIDRWLMRFRLYKKIRSAIIHEEKMSDSRTLVHSVETVICYEPEELNKASYQMRYSELFQTIEQLIDEIEKQLKPLHEKNDASLVEYLYRAEFINNMVETKLLCHKDWTL